MASMAYSGVQFAPESSKLPKAKVPDARINNLISQLKSLQFTKSVRDEITEIEEDLGALAAKYGLESEQLVELTGLICRGGIGVSQSVKLVSVLRPRSTVPDRVVLLILGRLGSQWAGRVDSVKKVRSVAGAKGKEEGQGKGKERLDENVLDDDMVSGMDEARGHERQGRVGYPVQNALLSHLIHILPYLSAVARETLERLYGVVFHYLEYDALQESLSHLLFLITRREHVKAFRISKLLAIRSKSISPASTGHLTSLLRLYSQFYPELVVVELGSRSGRRSGVFKVMFGILSQVDMIFTPLSVRKQKKNLEWIIQTEEMRSRFGTSTGDGEDGLDNSEMVGMDGERSAKRVRRGERIAIPSMANMDVGEDSTTLSEVRSLAKMAKNLDKLEMPSQAASILRSRAGGWAVVSGGGDASVIRRLSSWLVDALDEEVFEKDQDLESLARFGDLLRRILEFTRLSRELFPELELFLAGFLPIWGGHEHRKEIFDLLTYHKPVSYQVLYGHILRPLQKLFISATTEWRAELIEMLTKLMLNWGVRTDWKRVIETGQTVQTCLSELPPADYFSSLRELMFHTDRVANVAVQADPNSSPLHSSALYFYEAVSTLPRMHELSLLVVPSQTVAYTCGSSLNMSSISRFCGILADYKHCFEVQQTAPALPTADPTLGATGSTMKYPQTMVTMFNGIMMDYCNLLWRNKGLNRTEKNASGCGLTGPRYNSIKKVADARGQDISPAFSLTHSGAFVNLAEAFIREVESNAGFTAKDKAPVHNLGPVTAASLKELALRGGLKISWGDFRPALLDRLMEQGAEGLHTFLHASLSSLMNRRQSLNSPVPAGTPLGITSSTTTSGFLEKSTNSNGLNGDSGERRKNGEDGTASRGGRRNHSARD